MLNSISTRHTVFIDGDLSASADGSCPSMKMEKGKEKKCFNEGSLWLIANTGCPQGAILCYYFTSFFFSLVSLTMTDFGQGENTSHIEKTRIIAQ